MYSKPLPFLADAVLDRDLEPVDEDLVGVDRLAAHLLDLAHLDVLAVEVGVEEAQAVVGLRHLLERRGARQQQHLVGDLRGRDPDLLPVDDVAVALAAPRAVLSCVVSRPVFGSVTPKQALLLAAR